MSLHSTRKIFPRHLAPLAGLALGLGMASAALAQPSAQPGYPPAPPPPGYQPVYNGPAPLAPKPRAGTFGGALYGGALTCEYSDGNGSYRDCGDSLEAGGISLYGGFYLTPRLVLTGDLWGTIHAESDPLAGSVSISQTFFTATLRAYVSNRFWLQAGLGGAQVKLTVDDTEFASDTVPGMLVGAGIELMTKRSFALDLQFRYGTGVYQDGDTKINSIGLGIGGSWF
ncbi:MAG: hypothetical protein IPL79_18105 [Myxococcales bacterium]|nr:hypothetical protein [Myxococcales bacterium]